MRKIISLLTVIILIVSCGSNGKVGKYTKKKLPDNFSYKIFKDKSSKKLGKNELYVTINKKLTKGQIATLAEKLYDSKPKQRRFYIFYYLKGSKDNGRAWAVSNFVPKLKISINGTTSKEEANLKKAAGSVNGKIIGKYHDEYTSSGITVYKKDNNIFIKTTFKNGSSMTNEMEKIDVKRGMKLVYQDKSSFNGEYFILTKNNKLEFYNKHGKKFTTATAIGDSS